MLSIPSFCFTVIVRFSTGQPSIPSPLQSTRANRSFCHDSSTRGAGTEQMTRAWTNYYRRQGQIATRSAAFRRGWSYKSQSVRISGRKAR